MVCTLHRLCVFRKQPITQRERALNVTLGRFRRSRSAKHTANFWQDFGFNYLCKDWKIPLYAARRHRPSVRSLGARIFSACAKWDRNPCQKLFARARPPTTLQQFITRQNFDCTIYTKYVYTNNSRKRHFNRGRIKNVDFPRAILHALKDIK